MMHCVMVVNRAEIVNHDLLFCINGIVLQPYSWYLSRVCLCHSWVYWLLAVCNSFRNVNVNLYSASSQKKR